MQIVTLGGLPKDHLVQFRFGVPRQLQPPAQEPVEAQHLGGGHHAAYDKNGNLTSDGEKNDFTFNPFGQLVQIRQYGSATILANFQYNGLGQRMAEQVDIYDDNSGLGVPDGSIISDPWLYMPVDRSGRRLATYRASDTYPKETFIYHMGSTGPTHRGGVALRDSESTGWIEATTAAASTRPYRRYYNADFQGSTTAFITAAGALVEQYRYGPTGVPWGIPLGDVTGDGSVATGTDSATINAYVSASAYHVRADLDLNGKVETADKAIADAGAGTVCGRGGFSVMGVSARVAKSGRQAATVAGIWLGPRGARIPALGIEDGESDTGNGTMPMRHYGTRGNCGRQICVTDGEIDANVGWIGGGIVLPVDPGTDLPLPLPPPAHIKINCPNGVLPPSFTIPGYGRFLDEAALACAGKCQNITITCTTSCEATTSGCDINIGPCGRQNRWSYLRHELEHVKQFCVSGEIDNCNDRLARELAAYFIAGQCGRTAPPINAGSCCDRACDSVVHDSYCFGGILSSEATRKAACVTACRGYWGPSGPTWPPGSPVPPWFPQ